MTLSQDDQSVLTQAAERLAAINIAIAELTEEKSVLLSAFKNPEVGLIPRVEPYKFGKIDMKISENSRLDDGLAKRHLPATVYKQVSKQVLDTSAARKVLTEEQINKISKKFDNKIEVRLR